MRDDDFAGGHVPGAVNWAVERFDDDAGIDEVGGAAALAGAACCGLC